MKTALILGITGVFGRHTALALQATGWKIKAMMREPKPVDEFNNMDIVKGDVANYTDVKHAAENIDLIVYGISPPNYDWEGKVVEWLDVCASVAEEKQLAIVFPGNVYNFDPNEMNTIDETSPQHPITSKGELRKEMEQRLARAAKNGAQVIILRMGDYIAPNAKQSWISHIIQHRKTKIKISSPGDINLKRTWAYVPDAAKTAAMLCEKLGDLPAFNVFHFKGYQASIADIATTVSSISDKPVTIKQYPWWALYMVRPFLSAVRGIFEMRYLWNIELNMQDEKLKKTLANIPSTPLKEALSRSCNL